MAVQLIEDFRIDLSHVQSFKYLQAKQYDHNSRRRRLILTDNNIPLFLKGTEIIILSLYGDGKNYSNTTCAFGSDGYPYIIFTESMLSVAGDIDGEIHIYDNPMDGSSQPAVATTFNFKMTVSKSLLNQDRLVTSSEFNILNDLILQANTIPQLIKEFNKSQEKANQLIEQLIANITSYDSQFTDMKNQYTSDFDTLKQKYTNDFNVLIQQINSDITSYQENYNSLRTDFVNFKEEVVTWYTAAQETESNRVLAENKRQEDTAAAIKNCETATENTNQAISNAEGATQNAEAATEESRTQSAYAKSQGDRIEDLLKGFSIVRRTIDGGDLLDTTPSDNLFDGGTL